MVNRVVDPKLVNDYLVHRFFDRRSVRIGGGFIQ